jgi:hypothetical protein
MAGTATDSGYASMGMSQTKDAAEQDDNQTVFTDNQDLDIADDMRRKLSSALSNDTPTPSSNSWWNGRENTGTN